MELPSVLRGALKCLSNIRNKPVVLKVGGEVVISPYFKQVVEDIGYLFSVGVPITIVFGAGRQIDEKMRAHGMEIKKPDGMRVTPLEAIPLIKEVCDSIFLQIKEVFAGVGATCNLLSPDNILAEPLGNGHIMTGRAVSMTAGGIKQTEDNGAVTVVSPLACSESHLLNVNADEVAYLVAKETNTDKLIFLTGSDGVLNRDGETISHLSAANVELLIGNGTVKDGMIPKLRFAAKAFSAGVNACHIVNYKRGHLLEEILTVERSGTMIVP